MQLKREEEDERLRRNESMMIINKNKEAILYLKYIYTIVLLLSKLR